MSQKATGRTMIMMSKDPDSIDPKLYQKQSEMISMTAHQLRTGLAANKWIIKMLLDGDLGELENEQNRFLTKTFESNERMIELVNDLLNFQHTQETSDMPLVIADCDLVDLIDDMIFGFTGEAHQKRIQLVFLK
ncbi:MAG: histidine kinase dimerization/phospho-acceptor domain-containing protein, partial [Bacteroidota bacterium]